MAPSIPETQDFQFIAGSLALDFVNTIGNRLGSARDYLASPRDAARWVQLAGIASLPPNSRFTRSDLADIRGRRENLYALFAPCASRAFPLNAQPLAHLNRDLAALNGKRALRRVDGSFQWAINGSAAERLAYCIVADAAELLNSGSFKLIRRCQDRRCGWLFLDRSKQRNRRWCSMRDCGNRAKARRHYAQRRSDAL